MRINRIEIPKTSETTFKHKIESKVFFDTGKCSRISHKITLNNGKQVFIDTTTLYGKTLCKFLSLYDKTGDFIRTVAKSYRDGKLANIRHVDWK